MSDQWLDAPCRVPVIQASWLSAIAQGGRVIWPDYPQPFPDETYGLRGMVVGSVRDAATRVITPSRPVIASELGLSPDGRHVWIRSRAETVQVWDLETGAQHEYTPFSASVLQAVALDGARGLLASATYGSVSVQRIEGAQVTLLGLLRRSSVDNIWVALSATSLVVVSDLRGHEGRDRLHRGRQRARDRRSRQPRDPLAAPGRRLPRSCPESARLNGREPILVGPRGLADETLTRH